MVECRNCEGTGVVRVITGAQMRCPVCKGRVVIFDRSLSPEDFGGIDLSNGESFTRTRMSRRAKMRAMTDEQLAEYLVESAEELTAPDGDYHKHAERFALGWLRQEVEE